MILSNEDTVILHGLLLKTMWFNKTYGRSNDDVIRLLQQIENENIIPTQLKVIPNAHN